MKMFRTFQALVFMAAALTVCGVVPLLVSTKITGSTVLAQKFERSEPQVTASKDERLYMLNVLWFKQEGGAEKYQEYLRAAGPFAAKYGGKSDRSYVPETSIIGEFDADLVFFVEWPNSKAFTDFIQDPGYQAISHLRAEAIRDSLLIRCKRK